VRWVTPGGSTWPPLRPSRLVKLRCGTIERDRHGRLIAKLFSPHRIEIRRRLMSAVWALAYRRYSTDYVDAEGRGPGGGGGNLRETLGVAHCHRRGARGHPFWPQAQREVGWHLRAAPDWCKLIADISHLRNIAETMNASLHGVLCGGAGLLMVMLVPSPPVTGKTYCYNPATRAPYISNEGYCRVYEGVQISQDDYLRLLEESTRPPVSYCLALEEGKAFKLAAPDCPTGTFPMTEREYNDWLRAEHLN
jgi:hypothetical protein